MNNTFSLKRFGSYFVYDLRQANYKFGLPVLVFSLLPIIFVAIFQFFALLILGRFGDPNISAAMRFIGAWAAIVAVGLTFPAKVYGDITDKRSGANFLLLPASTFEQYLSMILICCVALPLVLGGIMLASDSIMALILPNIYGESCFAYIGKIDSLSEFIDISGLNGFDFTIGTFFEWCQYLCIFLLGALCFKRSKIVKTVLVLIGVGMVFSAIISIVMVALGGSIDEDFVERLAERLMGCSPEQILQTVKVIGCVIEIAVDGGLLAAIYLRLKKINL